MDPQERFVMVLDELDLPDRDVVAPVLAEIGTLAPSRAIVQPRVRGLAVAIAAVAVVVLGLFLAVEPARTAMADWLGIGATRIERVPEPDRTDGVTPSSAQSTITLPSAAESLGDPVDALTSADPIPALGPPSSVIDEPSGIGRGRSYAWSDSPDFPVLGDSQFGVVLSVRTTDGQRDWKRISADSAVEFVTVDFDGQETTGLWIAGTHELVRAATDQPVRADRVLLWVGPGSRIQYRLETNVGLVANLALARQVVGGADLLQ